jgi:hypothetical protein
VYVPTNSSLGNLASIIGKRMQNADKMCTDQNGMTYPMGGCFLSPGELGSDPANPLEQEQTAFDFNTWVYSRMQQAEWLEVMKHTFLLHYYGARAPFTYGSHPIEYTDPYDSYTLLTQANNWAYRDVTMWNKYTDRQAGYQAFVQWIQSDPVLSKETFFLSAKDMVDYMKAPFDKTGAAVMPDAVATPASNGIFSKVGWTAGTNATFMATSGNSATITFNIANPGTGNDPAIAYVSAGLKAGALSGVSHIDIKYKTDVPFRIRLLTSDGSTSVTALLAGVGGDRVARIRIKDFFLGPEASSSQVLGNGLVDATYMAKVTGIAIESAATLVAPSGTPALFAGGMFTTTIEQLTIDGVDTSNLCQ